MLRHLTALAFAALLAAQQNPPAKKFRLGNEVVPARCSLDLTVAPSEEQFAGAVSIALRIVRPATTVWLHAAELEITDAGFRGAAVELKGRPVTPAEPRSEYRR